MHLVEREGRAGEGGDGRGGRVGALRGDGGEGVMAGGGEMIVEGRGRRRGCARRARGEGQGGEEPRPRRQVPHTRRMPVVVGVVVFLRGGRDRRGRGGRGGGGRGSQWLRGKERGRRRLWEGEESDDGRSRLRWAMHSLNVHRDVGLLPRKTLLRII